MTGQIITEGVSTFTPILTRLLDIVKELIPYAIYIAIGALGVSLLWRAVKYILGYLKKETTRTFDNETIEDKKDEAREAFNEMIAEAEEEGNTERDLFNDYQDYIYKHGKYKDGNYPTQEERIKRIRERKNNHPGYDYF